MEYKLIRSKRKSISIVIDEKAQLIVRAPKNLSKSYIENYLISKKDWIEKNTKKMQEHMKISRPKEFVSGETFYVLGERYVFEISSDVKKLVVDDGRMLFPAEYEHAAKEVLEEWYVNVAKDYILERASTIAEQISIYPKKFGITRASKRWGSCSSKGNINFSYKLVMAKRRAVDYVIIHELCHLTHLNHSSEFWQMVYGIMPDYKELKKYLDDNRYNFNL